MVEDELTLEHAMYLMYNVLVGFLLSLAVATEFVTRDAEGLSEFFAEYKD